MKNEFKEFYKLTEAEFKKLWSNSIIVLDTNLLFNLYRYSESTTSDIFKLIESLSNQLWIPFRVGFEFQRKRIDIIHEEIQVYKRFENDVISLEQKILTQKRGPFISEKLTRDFAEFRKNIEVECEGKTDWLNSLLTDDVILEKLTNLFGEKVGKEFDDERRKNVFEEGRKRYASKIPPGYKDSEKPQDEDKFGDLIIWYQMIDVAKEKKKPVIFVTDDSKEDWWNQKHGKTFGPRPELLKEFALKTKNLCYLYQPFQFLEYANQFLNQEIDTSVINEVREFKRSKRSPESNYKILSISIDTADKNSRLNEYCEFLTTNGYEITVQKIDDFKSLLKVKLPKIDDLERRFKSKYIKMLNDYNLKLEKMRTSE